MKVAKGYGNNGNKLLFLLLVSHFFLVILKFEEVFLFIYNLDGWI